MTSTRAPDRPARGRDDVRVPIDPRIRERRAQVLRGRGRRRLRVACALVGVVVLAVVGWLLLHSRLFSARVITVVGSTHTPASEIVAAAGLAGHPPLIDVNGSAAVRLEQLPWVRWADVARQWPDGVRITVVERTPVAAVSAGGSRWAVLDRSGEVLADQAVQPTGLAVVVSAPPPGAPGTVLASAHAALTVAASLPVALRGQVATVEESGRTVTLHLTSAATVDIGSTVDLNQKFEDVAAILAGAPPAPGDVIDVTVPDEPVVSAGPAAPPATGSGAGG